MRYLKVVGVLIFALLSLWLSMNLHSRTGRFNYRSELFSDKAGYNMYLPATFVWGWDAKLVPPGLPDSIGLGFHIDANGKLFTKYPIGVAVMQLPFFLVTHWVVAPLTGAPRDGLSMPYHKALDFAAWVYLIAGMCLLWQVLGTYFSPRVAGLTVAAMLLGTNLLYYGVVESGMSHIYSFFLVCLLLRLVQMAGKQGGLSMGLGLAMGFVAALLVLTRFTNVLLLSLFLWDVEGRSEIGARLSWLRRPAISLAFVLGPMLLIGLQLCYYQYLSGRPWMYSYGGEGFHFLRPEVLRVLFSPKNGLFPFAPVLLLSMIGMAGLIYRRQRNGWLVLGLFVVPLYVFSSWHQWFFGCAFGARSFVEYLPVYAFPFASFLHDVKDKPLVVRKIGGAVLFLVLALMTKATYLYKLCYLGDGDWDWGWWVGQFL